MSQTYSRLDIQQALQARGFRENGENPFYRLLDALGRQVQSWWAEKIKDEVQNQRFRASYLQSLSVEVDYANGRVRIGFPLNGQTKQSVSLGLIAELGFGGGGIGDESPYDLRKYMFGGKLKVHHTKDGRAYVNVPMNKSAGFVKTWAQEHARTSQETISTELARINQKPHKYAADILGTIRRAPGSEKGAVYALRNSVDKLKSRHESDPFNSMIRVAATYSQGADTKAVVQTADYRIWRRMYETNNDGSWIHPGLKGKHLKGSVLAGRVDTLRQIGQELMKDVDDGLRQPRQGA